MDQKRFFAWLLLMIALFLLMNNANQQAARKREEAAEAALRDEVAAQKRKEERQARLEKTKEQTNLPPAIEVQPSRTALGSMDARDNYRLLVTTTSLGAGIERIELVGQKKPGKFLYRSLSTKGGYLGYLAIEPNTTRLKIQSVPLGSPASMAICRNKEIDGGLRVGDELIRFDGQDLMDDLHLESLLAKRKPNTVVDVAIRRADGEAEPQELVFTTKLSEPPLDIIRLQDDLPREEIPGNLLRPSLMTSVASIDAVSVVPGQESIPGLENILQGHWQAETLQVENGVGVEYRLPLSRDLAIAGINANLELVKRYRVYQTRTKSFANPSEAAYHLDVEALVRNLDDREHTVAMRQEGTNGLTLEAWWYAIKLSQTFFGTAGARDVMFARKFGPHELITRRAIQEYSRSHPQNPENPFFGPDFAIDQRSFRYLGIDQQYFTTAILPHPEQQKSLDDLAQGATRTLADLNKLKPYKDIGTNVSFWFDTQPIKLEPLGEASRRYLVYAGPKDPELLQAYGLNGSLYFGWAIFEWVAKPLSFILHAFYSLVRNYGIAIVMLTILVRSCMFPLSRRAAIMGQRMQEMQPEMKRINELYKDDMNKRGQEMQALYKKYNLNPMASCLPVFIQIPIFIGLYRCVSTDIALRQQPLIPGLQWCSNLAGPDMLASFPSWMPDFIAGKGTGWFGPYLNLLPIITITLFIVQQKVLMPKPTDEQARMTQQMMMIMTVFMGILFFKVPAGLCIYFITSSIWSLVERKLIKKFMPAATLATQPNAASPKMDIAQRMTPRTSNKPPETFGEVMDSIRSLWSKRDDTKSTERPSLPTAARKKLRKKK